MTTTTATATATAAVTGVVLGTVTFSSNASQLTVAVACKRAKPCTGKVTVTAPTPARPRSAGAPAFKTVTLGQTGYRIGSGKTKVVRVKIAQRYRSMLRSGRIRTVKITSGAATLKRKVVLPAAKTKGG